MTKKLTFEQELNKRLEKAAASVAEDIDNHFKKDKWALWYGFHVDEIFNKAFGYQLEKHLLSELSKRKGKYFLRTGNKGSLFENQLLIDLTKNKKKVKNKRKIITIDSFSLGKQK